MCCIGDLFCIEPFPELVESCREVDYTIIRRTNMKGFLTTRVLGVASLVLLAAGNAKATLPGVNGRITFARLVPDTDSESIFSIRPDVSDEPQLTFDAANQYSQVTQLSPGGSLI